MSEDDLFSRRPMGMRMAMVVRQWRAVILHVGQESAHFQPLSPEKAYIRSVGTELPAAIILLYKHLTEWIAVENYLVIQRYFLN